MTWVKVCGLTARADVEAAVAAGADAVGFVNVLSSPRFVPLSTIADIAAGVRIQRILLTMDARPERVVAMLEQAGMSGVQPYGKDVGATAAAAAAAGFLVLHPVSVGDEIHLDEGTVGVPLLDTAVPGSLGGTGKVFNWELADGIGRRFVLAGGLGPGNVAAAVAAVEPWGVDASSGLERVPGVKDHSMVADFVAEAKGT